MNNGQSMTSNNNEDDHLKSSDQVMTSEDEERESPTLETDQEDEEARELDAEIARRSRQIVQLAAHFATDGAHGEHLIDFVARHAAKLRDVLPK